jgi:hypothetical protein
MSNNTSNSFSDILFQKMGTTWYAFAEIGGEVVYTALPEGCNPQQDELDIYHLIEEQLNEQAQMSRRSSPEIAA